MKKIIFYLVLFYSTCGLALPTPINVWLQCENGIHATLDKDMQLSIEGIYKLPLIKTEDDKHDRTTLVFADSQVSAKILIIHTIPAFFISDSNVWVPCKVRKYQQGSTK